MNQNSPYQPPPSSPSPRDEEQLTLDYQRETQAQRSGGSWRLFQLWGINVYLHWTWLIVAVLMIRWRTEEYSSPIWAVADYLTLFLIVLLHEFGHALACRSVGGTAERIVLWPLGGVAFVNPPPRAGALLWSIVAGPLVNVILVPITVTLAVLFRGQGGDLAQYFFIVAVINAMLLIFNLLPIYPLDGGQILRALLWFIVGRARSLQVAAVIGLFGAAGVVALALAPMLWGQNPSFWLIILAAFGALQSWNGFKQAQYLQRLTAGPRHLGFACPYCHQPPPAGTFWRCDQCGQPVDPFTNGGACPACGAPSEAMPCPACGQIAPAQLWQPHLAVIPPAMPHPPPHDWPAQSR